MEKIGLRTIGDVAVEILEQLRQPLQETFSRPVEKGAPLPLPNYAYDAGRRQYHAMPILRELAASRTRREGKVLGIADVDLYVPQLNFVFGLADAVSGTCVISICRLRQEYYGLPRDDELFLERVLKESIHELGHIYGLGHCTEAKCVMYFSNSLRDTDRKGRSFCPRCQERLEVHS
ncbi:MAG: archaemetzincin family Zn-dependent metalloprotease [Chloroflexi bacterium]|nr:archaemetzincin family Zn-dependent metalloprotease [Chloroflexota bacterium]MCL5076066.1 archaemetzincin family Zn-dependent metalloprotease [Chloroflexota bacterium]